MSVVTWGRSLRLIAATPMYRIGPGDLIGTVHWPGTSGVSAMEGIREIPTPSGDERAGEEVVGGGPAHVRIEAGALGVAAQVCLGLQAAEHPGFCCQLGEVERMAVGESVPLRQDDVQGVFQERRPLHAGAGARPDGERAVEVVGESEVHGALADERQGVLGFALPDVEHGAGMGCHEPGESSGHQEPAAAGEGGDGELRTAGAELGDLLLCVFELRGDGFGGADHDLSGLGEGDAAGAAGDDLSSEAALQGGHLLGDSRGVRRRAVAAWLKLPCSATARRTRSRCTSINSCP